MTEPELFKEVHRQLLDYLDAGVTDASNWGLDAYSKIKEAGLELVTGGMEKQTPFIYAVTTAVIIGEFSKRGYMSYFCNTTEIDLCELDIEFDDIEGFVSWDISPERIKVLREQYCVNLQDIWRTINDYKRHIHRSLTLIYANKEREPKVYMFKSLNKILGEDAFLEKLDPKTFNAYLYIENGFGY